MVDCTVVGQGIAGTCLVHSLLDRGLSVQIFDDDLGHTASLRAAGVINPITGRRFVKTWQADEVIHNARRFYTRLEQKMDEKCLFTDRSIAHVMNTPIMEENWILREGEEGYSEYMGRMLKLDDPALSHRGWYGELHGALQVNMAKVLESSKAWFDSEGVARQKVLKHYTTETRDLTAKIHTRFIIFCEGSAVAKNPHFSFLPHFVAKGEALICSIPFLKTDVILKGEGISIAPMWEDDLYWIGSTYAWDDYDPTPTEKARMELEGKLGKFLNCSFEVVTHIAGIRPTAQDRRPYVGAHPDHRDVLLLNGLGTKGASLAPYCAEALAEHIANGADIPEGMNLLRYYKG